MHHRCGHGRAKFIVFIVAGIAIGGVVTMLLWNWLAPALFGWKTITFLQALGILLLTRLRFGGLHGRRGCAGHWHRNPESMTPEEREQLRDRLHHCGFGRRLAKCGDEESAEKTEQD
jgi:hypothetical protein